MGEQKFISSSLLPYVGLSIVIGSLLRCSVGQKNVCSSSCGLQTISPPFHLKGDPDFCGDPDFELICADNTTLIMELYDLKYHVTNISYENAWIEIVGDNLASGRCILPSTSFPSAVISTSRINNYQFMGFWDSFVNCSMEIQNDMYQPVSCLSGNNTFVYLTYKYQVAYLFPSCSFLSMVPSSGITSDRFTDDIFRFLKKGFVLSWAANNPTISEIIDNSLQEAFGKQRVKMQGQSTIFKWLNYPISLESYFLERLDQYKHFHQISQGRYTFAVVCIVLLDIAMVLLVIATLGRFVIAPLSMYVFLSHEFWKIFVLPIDIVEKFLRNQQAVMPTRYAYTDIIAITRHFKEKLGQGGFGSVYKGELPGGFLVAVKMLGNSKCNGEEFINEVSTIGMIHHINVVRLVGFCSEGSNRALVYEFMCNGSLDKHIFSSNGTNSKFTTKKLSEIALGVSRGIDYLHRGCDMRILHFDIKPHNILLDHDFNPKVSDFGLAKLYPKDYSFVSACAARGTIGYMAPEVISRSFGLISYKSDVYSFGMLLLEMAGGRRNFSPEDGSSSSKAYYPSWIYDQLNQTTRLEFCNTIEIGNVERKLAKIGLWCIQMQPSVRPTMSKVIEMLEADVDGVDMPPKPFLFSSAPSARRSSMKSSLTEISIICENE